MAATANYKSFQPLTQKLDSKAVTPWRGRPAGPKPLPKQDMNIYHPPLNPALSYSLLLTSKYSLVPSLMSCHCHTCDALFEFLFTERR